MSQQGFIKLHRKIQDHWIYQEKRKFSKYEAWLDMLMMANHKDNKFAFGNELVEVKKGSFITSELKLMDRWDWGKEKLRTFLKMLENDSMIVKKSDRKKTTITICNYCVYHEYETENRPQTDHKQTDSRLSADTNKNVNNDKECKEEKNNRPKQVYDDTSPYFQMSIYFFERIKLNNPDHKQPNFQMWSEEIRKMVELDHRTDEQIKYLMKWVQEDDFEKANVLSPTKLRKRFDNLIMKVKQQKNKQPKRSIFEQGEESKKRQAETKPLSVEEQEQIKKWEEELPY